MILAKLYKHEKRFFFGRSSPLISIFLSFTDASDESNDILNEIECFSTLSHPNIVQYYGCGRDVNQIAIFMEYLPGGSMAQYVKQSGGFLEEPEVQRFAVQILSGLDYLHQQSLVHRDIKGSNLLLDQDWLL